MGVLKTASKLLGLAVLIYIVAFKVQWSRFVQVIYNLNYVFVVLAFLAMVLMIFVKFSRIYLNLKSIGVKVGKLKLFRIYINSLLLGQITTQAITTLTAAGATIVSTKGEKKIRIGNVYILNNLLDLVFAILIFFVCITLNPELLGVVKIKLGVWYVTFFIAMAVFFTALFLIYRNKISQRVSYFFEEIAESFKLSVKSSLILTFVVWIVYGLSCYLEAKVFYVNLPFSYLLLVYVAGSVITAMPISVAGLGTRDLAFIYLLGLSGVKPERAFLLSLFSFIINPVAAIAFLYLLAAIIKERK